MKSITIHNLDDRASKKLKALAESKGMSLNKTIKKLLYQALNLEKDRTSHRQEFEMFLNVWSSEEADTFEKNIEELKKVNTEDWK
jgi:plasmid stability protein